MAESGGHFCQQKSSSCFLSSVGLALFSWWLGCVAYVFCFDSLPSLFCVGLCMYLSDGREGL